MLTVPPWREFNLSIICFSNDSESWWKEARLLGGIVRTDAAKRKWLKDNSSTGAVDAWGKRGVLVDRVKVVVRLEGVDGDRLNRNNHSLEIEAIAKIIVHDGRSCNSCYNYFTLTLCMLR